MKQSKLDKTYMRMAQELSTLSHAQRRKVGCLIVKDTHIIAEGINGTPRGFDNNCEYVDHVDHYYTKPEVLHAESNAITKLACSTNSSKDATVYITCSPCYECSKLMIQSGIKRVVYFEKYRDESGLALLNKAGVETTQIKEN
jgi:dCMP deaminase|tara:strand:+ start:64 stop:492 length:429 start_codon:yes stop_codon:yes gene_type:complete